MGGWLGSDLISHGEIRGESPGTVPSSLLSLPSHADVCVSDNSSFQKFPALRVVDTPCKFVISYLWDLPCFDRPTSASLVVGRCRNTNFSVRTLPYMSGNSFLNR